MGSARPVGRPTAISIALAAVPLGAFALAAWSQRWTHDDGFITLRVVEHVVAGDGPVYNAGQRVEAYTSPVHLAVLVVLRVALGWAVDVAWLGACATLAAATAGLALAAAGAARLARAGGATGVLVPFGLLVPVALPPMWEYATAGLETGLAIGWIGATFWVLAGLAARGRPHAVARRRGSPAPEVAPGRLAPVAVLVGLGPLVRPELALVTVAWLVVLCRLELARERPWWRLVATAAALPV
ncbi:MAG: hypothetical protein KDA97_12525, partial [Acidimicrobiales bacterium]|nr:hypothetical protein [Acidimicrobiales bacterium]